MEAVVVKLSIIELMGKQPKKQAKEVQAKINQAYKPKKK